MRSYPVRAARWAVPALLACTALVSGVSAQARGAQTSPAPETRQQDQRQLESRVREPMDAERTRQELMQVLERHPPSVGRVLKLDPSLMQNESYLATYPQLREFLGEHPEVPQNAAYYLDRIQYTQDWPRSTPQQQMVQGILAGLAGLTAAGIVLGTLIWLIRTALDHRRWNRLSKIQAEVHTKLMDRFSSNDELLTYVQTPSGRRFLESGPSPLQEAGPAMAAPFSRILWSVQAGAVLLVSGVGMLFLSGRAVPDAREFFYIAGCLATAIGAGFVVSAAASYVLSKRLGLLDSAVQPHA
ncbi:MAG: hypothetical protein ACRD1U_15490 [Vicinamibacterales bacterium]